MENHQDRRLYRKGYDPEYWHKRSQIALESVTADEALTWLKHPCTQALLYQLQADISSKVLGWMHGMYADSQSIDHTAQAQAKVLGQAQACDETIDMINQIGKGQFEGGDENGD